jgi:peptidyl-prolyl cis-trans isomerase B (cyclophilin B)
MARSGAPDSASSQFFFTLSDSATHLDGKYAAFGYVVSGWDVIEAAAKIPTNSNDKPTSDILIEQIVFVTPVAE